MKHIVQLDLVSKSFAGRRAVENLSFNVRRGEVFALLGPNGAGKTTTGRMLVGVIRPDHGRIIATVEGRTTDVLPADSVGYLPEDRGLAAYKDENGALHRRSAVCTHLYCIVDWNDTEKTWDCPHGSRFDRYGSVINGPAISNLPRVDEE